MPSENEGKANQEEASASFPSTEKSQSIEGEGDGGKPTGEANEDNA